MTPRQIRKIVEDYHNYWLKKEKLQDRLINLAGRDPEQEIVILQRLEFVEQSIEIVDFAVYGDVLLTPRESRVVEHRMDGLIYEEIGKIFSLTRQRVEQILKAAYKKIADAANKKNVA